MKLIKQRWKWKRTRWLIERLEGSSITNRSAILLYPPNSELFDEVHSDEFLLSSFPLFHLNPMYWALRHILYFEIDFLSHFALGGGVSKYMHYFSEFYYLYKQNRYSQSQEHLQHQILVFSPLSIWVFWVGGWGGVMNIDLFHGSCFLKIPSCKRWGFVFSLFLANNFTITTFMYESGIWNKRFYL